MQWRREEEEDYINFMVSGTGSISDKTKCRVIYRDYDKYHIGVIVDSDNKFIGIAEVGENRDFLSPKQRISTRSTIDADEYYKE